MRSSFAVFSVAAAFIASTAVSLADTVAYNSAPLSNVVDQLDHKYGIHIVLEGNLAQHPTKPVTFSAGDTTENPTRLQVVNALANAAGVTFQKGFVVSKVSGGASPPSVPIDNDGNVYFHATTVDARKAIALVAALDNSTVTIASDVTGVVTFPTETLSAKDAANDIAQQTHTVWTTYYALRPSSMGLRGTIVGRTSLGQPIVELPFAFYPPPPAKKPTTTASVPPANAPGTQTTGQLPAVGAVQNPNSGVGVYPYGAPTGYGSPYFTYGNGYGYTPYGGGPYPYSYGGFGYGSPGGGSGVTIMPGSGGYGPFGGYGAPVTF